jgi:hypothetical protein
MDNEHVLVVLITYIATVNRFGDMMACDVQRAIAKHTYWVRHVGLFGVLFLVRSMGEHKGEPLWIAVREAAILYAVLVMSTKCTMWTFLPAAACLIGYVSMWLWERRSGKEPSEAERGTVAAKVKKAFKVGLYVFVVGGFALYAVKQYRDRGKRFTVAKFLFTTKACRSLPKLDHGTEDVER